MNTLVQRTAQGKRMQEQDVIAPKKKQGNTLGLLHQHRRDHSFLVQQVTDSVMGLKNGDRMTRKKVTTASTLERHVGMPSNRAQASSDAAFDEEGIGSVSHGRCFRFHTRSHHDGQDVPPCL
jgi:hypothetical protein